MGNKHSFEQHVDFKDLKTKYVYEKKFNDNRFGEVKLIKEKSTGQKLFQKDFTTSNEKEFNQYIKDIESCARLNHPNVLKIYGYNTKKDDVFCADFYKLSLFFESFETDLEKEIVKREKTHDFYNEAELWFLLDSVASSCSYLQSNQIPHRDVRPYNIFITSSKEYKIAPTNLFKQHYNPGHFGHFDDLESKSRLYSPEFLKYHGTPQENRTPYDEYKHDVFGLGMSLVEAGLLERPTEAYDFKKLEVRPQIVQDSLNRLRNRYSEDFVKTVENTLDFNPQTRLDFLKLDRGLSVYRRKFREDARGGTTYYEGSPTYKARAPVIEYSARKDDEKPLNTQAPAPVHNVNEFQDELDRRVREAVQKSHEAISRASPTRKPDVAPLGADIQSYLNNNLPISSQSNSARLNNQRVEGNVVVENRVEGVKRSLYIDVPETYAHQQIQQVNYVPSNQYNSNVGYGTGSFGQGSAVSTGGVNANVNVEAGVGAQADVRNPLAQSTYGTDADELTRQIEERLRQSRLVR